MLSDRVTSAGNLDSSAGCLDCAPAAPGAAEEDPTHDTIHKDADFSVRLSKGGAADTDNGLWVDSTVNAVSTRECREGGSPAAAIAAPAGREGELPSTL